MKLAGLLLALVATAAAKDGFCKVAECKACKEGAGINYLASLPLLTRSLGSVSHDWSAYKTLVSLKGFNVSALGLSPSSARRQLAEYSCEPPKKCNPDGANCMADADCASGSCYRARTGDVTRPGSCRAASYGSSGSSSMGGLSMTAIMGALQTGSYNSDSSNFLNYPEGLLMYSVLGFLLLIITIFTFSCFCCARVCGQLCCKGGGCGKTYPSEGLCCGCKCCFGLDLKDHQAEYPLRAKAAACACIGIFILLSVGMIAAGQFKGNLGMTQGMYRVVGAGMTPTADLVQGGVKPVSGMLGGLIGKDLLSFMENLNATVYPNFRTKVINENLDCILSSVNELPDPAELKTTVAQLQEGIDNLPPPANITKALDEIINKTETLPKAVKDTNGLIKTYTKAQKDLLAELTTIRSVIATLKTTVLSLKTPIGSIVSTLGIANTNMNAAEFAAVGPLITGLSSKGCSNLSPVKCQGSDEPKQVAYRKDVKDKLNALKLKVSNVVSADPTLTETGVLMTDVNTTLDTASGENMKLKGHAEAMDVIILALPTSASTDALLTDLKAQIDGFKVGGAINITNRLNASVASFPDPGIVTSFVAGIEGAKTIPPCLIVVSTEIQRVNATIIILPAALGSVVGMVDGVDDTLKQVINGTKGFSAGAAELDKTLVAMGMGKNSSGGGGIQGQAELVELQKAVTEMGKSTDFDDLKKKIASVSTKGTTNTKAVTDKVAELDGKLNDPNMRPSKKAADEMADLDTRLADLPTQLADAVKGIEQWENAGVCVSTSATNGMSCSDNASCGMGGTCNPVFGAKYPAKCKERNPTTLVLDDCTKDSDCTAAGCSFPAVDTFAKNFDDAAGDMGPFDDGGTVVKFVAELQTFLDDIDNLANQTGMTAAVDTAEAEINELDVAALGGNLEKAEDDLSKIPDLKAMKDAFGGFAETLDEFKKALPQLSSEIEKMEGVIDGVKGPLNAAKAMVTAVADLLDNRMGPLLTKMREIRTSKSLSAKLEGLALLITDVMNVSSALGQSFAGVSNGTSSSSSSSSKRLLADPQGQTLQTMPDCSDTQGPTCKMSDGKICDKAPCMNKDGDQEGPRENKGGIYDMVTSFGKIFDKLEDTDGTSRKKGDIWYLADAFGIKSAPTPTVDTKVAKSAARSNRVFKNEKDMAYTDGKMCLEKTCLDNEVAFYNQATIKEMTNGAIPVPINREILMLIPFVFPLLLVLLTMCGCIGRVRCPATCSLCCMCLMVPFILFFFAVFLFPLVMATGDFCLSAEPLIMEVADGSWKDICVMVGGTAAPEVVDVKAVLAGGSAGTMKKECLLNLTKMNAVLPNRIISLDFPALSREVFGAGTDSCGEGGGQMGGLWQEMSSVGDTFATTMAENLIKGMEAGEIGGGINLRPDLQRELRSAAAAVGATLKGSFGGTGSESFASQVGCKEISAAYYGVKSSACCGVLNGFYWYVFSWVCLAFFMLTCGVCGNILGYKRLSKDANLWREHHTGHSVEELVDQPPPPPSYGGPPGPRPGYCADGTPLPGPPPVASPAGDQVRPGSASWWNRNPMSRPPSSGNVKQDAREQIELVQRAPTGGYDSSHVPAAIAVNSLHVQ